MFELLTNNWEWALLIMYVTEKIILLSPSKKDDLLFQTILQPIFKALKGKK